MKRMMFSGADKLLFQRAQELRKRETPAETILWGHLKAKPFGYKFRRQHPYSIYILDFYCHALRLAIEVDGSIHLAEDVKLNDERRQKHLEENGLTVMRFTNEKIIASLEEVINRIEEFISKK